MIILKDFELKAGNHCLYSALYNLFQYLKINLQEYEIFFLCNGFSLKIDESDTNNKMLDELLGIIKIDYQTQLETLSNRTLINSIHVLYSNKQQAQTKFIHDLSNELMERRPLLVFVKSKALKYHVMENPRDNLGAHSLLIKGFDSTNQFIYLADSFVTNFNNQKSTVESTVLLNEIEPYIIAYCQFRVEKFKYSRKLLYTSLIYDLKNYLNSNKYKGIICGHNALCQIMINIDNMVDNLFLPINQNNFISLIFLMKAYFYMILPYFELFIIQEKNLYLHRDKLIQKIHELQNNWNSFFLRCMSAIGDKSCNIKKIIKSGLEAVDKQAEFFKMLLKAMEL